MKRQVVIIKNLFIDISSYQRSDLGFFEDMKAHGVKGVMVKVTEGDASGSNYVNPKWTAQVTNAIKAGLQTGVYHFARWSSPQNARTEANFFLKQVLPYGFDSSTAAMVDCETNQYGLSSANYQACVNAWLDEVGKHFARLSVYANKSWWTTFLNSHNIGRAVPWLAGYNITSLGINNAGAWQFTDNFYGVDASYDFVGIFTTSDVQPKPQQQPKPAGPRVITLKKGEEVIIRDE